ncbi:MAG: protein kinase [Betaproteobacteria bacterium]
MNRSDWERRSALFDEAVERPADARSAWLSAIALSDPTHLNALKRMLAEFEKPPSLHGVAPSVAGLDSNHFEASLDAATSDSLQLQPGNRVGAWELVRKIGEGGMGEVWLASRSDGHYDGNAAIKFLRTGLGKSQIVERFLRERRLLARLTHPGIARLLDAGTHQDEPYLVMEYIEGQPITTWAAEHAPRVADRVALMLKVCRAAEYAHGQLIVHRDLKPSNVLVTGIGEPSLLDFGIAKLMDDEDDDYGTALTRMTGRGYTLGYCAPEQITGEPTGVAADVFSIGVLLFELLTGTLPFRPQHGREGRAALEHAIVHDDAKSVSRAVDDANTADTLSNARARPIDAGRARGDMEAIVARALRKNPADRYATVSALADDLDRWLNNMPVLARRGNWQYMTMLWLMRNRALAIVATAAFIAVGAGMVTALWQADRANDEAQRASDEAQRADQEKVTAIEQRRRAEIATAQATAALSESERAKRVALQAQKQADENARAALESAQLATRNELRSRKSEADAAAASGKAQSEAAKAKAVNQYLVTLFESADPEHTKGEKLTAREVLDTGAKSLAAQFANDPETLAELQAVLGQTYVGLSQPQTAIPLLTAAATATAKKYGPRSVEHARIVYTLARAEMETESFPDSERHYRAALEILEPVEGIASETNVVGTVNLSYALQKQGKFAEIDPLIAPVRAATIAQRGEKDWLFAEIENSRAVAMAAQSKVKEEQSILLNIEPLLQNPPPNKRSDALTIRNNLAVSFARTGNLAEAIPRVNGVLQGFIEHLGTEAELTMKVMWFAGDLRRQAGQYGECVTQFERLADLRARVTGEAHPLSVDVFSKVASCAQLAGNEALAGRFAARALANLPANDTPPQRNVLRTLLTLQIMAVDRAGAPASPALLPRARAVARGLNLALATPESLWMMAIVAHTAARAGDFKGALRTMDALLEKVPAFAGLPGVRAMHANLLLLDGQVEAARIEMVESHKLAKSRYAEAHPVNRVLDYVDAIIARPDERVAAQRALEGAAGRVARLPLAPNWFGL